MLSLLNVKEKYVCFKTLRSIHFAIFDSYLSTALLSGLRIFPLLNEA